MNFVLPLASSLGVGVALIASRRHSRSDSSADSEPVHTSSEPVHTAESSTVAAPVRQSSGDKPAQQGEEPATEKKMNAEKVKAGGGNNPEGAPPAAERSEPEKKVVIRIDPELEASAMQKKVSAYREQIVKHIVSSGAIKVTLEGFPYYMSESTKTLLVNSATTFLKRHEFVKYMKQLSTISPRILLVGPNGSEAYQETTVKALARQFGAKLLIFDNTAISLDVQYPCTPRVAPIKAEINGLDFLDGDDASSVDSKDRSDSPSGPRLGRTSSLGKKVDDLAEPSVKDFLSWVQEQLKQQSQAPPPAPSDGAASPTKPPPIPLDHVLGLLHEYGDKLERTTSGDVLRSSPSGTLFRTSSGPNCVSCLKRTSSVASELTEDDVAGGQPGDAAGGEVAPPAAKEAAPLAKKELAIEDRVVFIGATAAKNATFTTFGGFHGKLVKKRDAEPNLGVIFDGPFPGGHSLNGACDDGRGYYCYENELRLEGASDETKALIDALFEVIAAEGEDPLIVYIRDVENWILNNFEAYTSFKERIERVHGRVLVMTSYISKEVAAAPAGGAKDDKKEALPSVPSQLAALFPSEILIRPPQDETMLDQWKRQLKKDSESMRADANRKMLRQVLASSNIKCDGLSTVHIDDKILSEELAKRVAGWAANHYLVTAEKPEVRNNKLVISSASLAHAIEMLNSIHDDSNSAKKALRDVVIDNDFEKNLLSEVIPANELGVDFADVGALDDVKDVLKELVMLPLQFPDLFAKSQLTKPCKGILLFGPPGTGKTMLAKAVATEAGANFINVSMSKITSKWFGEDEKYVRALFTLASKIAPCTIFIDEVDSMLGRRDSRHEAEAMRKIKNEFMTCWDGLRTREKERVLVLAATNRPFDLDEAVLRRFPRRVMIPLPDVENREKILRVVLEKEELGSDIDYKELAEATEGYSGSDLKNMCVTAAYRPVRELLNKLKKDKEAAKAAGQDPAGVVPQGVRPLSMEDLRKAKEQVAASVSPEASIVQELMQWNEQYGEGGSRKKPALTYFM